jgi:hypothetical protein
MFAVLRLRDTFSLGMAALLCLAGVALLTLRFYVFYFVVLASVGASVFGRRGLIVPRMASYGVLLTVLVGAFTFAAKRETLETQRAFMTLEQMQVTRMDQAMWGKSAYGTEYDVSTTAGALQAQPAGLVFLLFAPFPWAIAGIRPLLVLPETVVWHTLMPAFVRGLTHSIRQRFRDVLPILVSTVTLTIAYVFMQGNVGTAYRQRTQVTMFVFLFMAVGIVQDRRRDARHSSEDALSSELVTDRSAGEGSGVMLGRDFGGDKTGPDAATRR